jgi:hypothetical protein
MGMNFQALFTQIKAGLARAGDLAQTRRRAVFFCLGGLLLLLLCLIAVLAAVSISAGSGGAGNAQALSDTLGPRGIPPEELFLPEEPDFLPGVLLDRERRESWTGEDAGPFWTDPREDSPGLWRDRIETTIDDMLKGVP